MLNGEGQAVTLLNRYRQVLPEPEELNLKLLTASQRYSGNF
jgi:hypothetical protein